MSTTFKRDAQYREIMRLYRPYLTRFPEVPFVILLASRYQVSETQLMTVEQLGDLVAHMEERLRRCVSNEEIRCPDCWEWTTRHEPCCPGTPQCACEVCERCGELFPELDQGLCLDCVP